MGTTDTNLKVVRNLGCFHPMKAFKVDDNQIRFVHTRDELKLWEKYVDRPDEYCFYGKPLRLPCGKCIGCRLAYSSEWALRCLLEAKYSIREASYFVTLTYDNEHIHDDMRRYAVDPDTGEVMFDTLSLWKPDLQKFMKRLRINAYRQYGIENIRFFASGEYGGKTKRPHYHLVLFNYDVPRYDLTYVCPGKSGQDLYESELLTSSWNKGFALLGPLTYNAAAYTAGYVVKKKKGLTSKSYYSSLGIDPEFATMSRRPGLGAEFYYRHSDKIYPADRVGVSIGGKLYNPRPLKYFDRLFEVEHGSGSLDELKDNRIIAAADARRNKIALVNMPIDELFRKEEINLVDKVNQKWSLTL